MPRGHRLSKAARQLISQEAKNQRNKDRNLLAIELKKEIDELDGSALEVDTIKKLISKYRNETLEEVDKPWTLAASNLYNFPPESTPILLRIWKICNAVGTRFTIREAKWVIYLTPMISNVGELLKRARYYASEERINKLINDDINSTELDSVLLSNMTEYLTQCLIGITIYNEIPGRVPMVRPNSTPYFGEDSLEAAKIIEQIAMNPFILTLDDNIYKNIIPVNELNLCNEVIWIYVYWFSVIMKSPQWKSFDKNQVIEIINELRAWASNFESLLPVIHQNITDNIKIESEDKESLLNVFLKIKGTIPNEILLQVGFNTDNPKDPPGYWDKLSRRLQRSNRNFKTFITHHPNFDFNNASWE